MDIVIVVLGAGVCTFLSRQLHTSATTIKKKNVEDATSPRMASFRLLTVSAGLSISLFSISVLELLPSDFILWIKGDAILWVYHFVLWGMVLHCFLVVPTACFMAVAQLRHQTFSSCWSNSIDDEDQKKRSFRRHHWIRVWVYKPIKVVVENSLQALLSWLVPCFKRNHHHHHHASSTLPLTVNVTTATTIVPTSVGNVSLSSRTLQFFHPTIRKILWFGMFLGSSCTYFAVSRLRPWVIHTTDEIKLEESLFQIAISSLCAVGILLSACLNGFGSVSLPYTCLLGFLLQPVSTQAIRNAEKELEAVQSRLSALEQQQQQQHRTIKRNVSSDPVVVAGDLRGGVRRNVSSSEAVFDVVELSDDAADNIEQAQQYALIRRQAEVDFLMSLITEIIADIEEMKYVKMWSTKRGIVRRVSGVIFSAILLVRLAAALLNVCFPSNNDVPSLPLVSLILMARPSGGGHYYRTDQLTQVVSVFLTAILSITQLRTFVTAASALQRRVRKTCCGCPHSPEVSATPSVLLLWTQHAVGWLLCCYSLACVVLTKQMMGSEIDDTSEHLYLQFHIDHFTVDLTYGTSALLSASVLAIVLGILRANSQRYAENAALSPMGLEEV